jgi:hypothetical protein
MVRILYSLAAAFLIAGAATAFADGHVHGGHHHGGHSGLAQAGHAHAGGAFHGHFQGGHHLGDGHSHGLAPRADAFHGFADCPARLHDGTFCPRHGVFFGGPSYRPEAERAEGTPESDLGPWIIFLWLARGIAKGARWLTGW